MASRGKATLPEVMSLVMTVAVTAPGEVSFKRWRFMPESVSMEVSIDSVLLLLLLSKDWGENMVKVATSMCCVSIFEFEHIALESGSKMKSCRV